MTTLSKNALIHAVYDELKGKMSKEDATYAARRIVEICRPEANNTGEEETSELDPASLAIAMGSIGVEPKDGPSYADIQERWNLDANYGARDD